MDQNLRVRAAGGATKMGGVSNTSAPTGVSVARRLRSELQQMMMSTAPGISAFVDGDDLFSWQATIEGPPGSMYENLSYKLSLKFPVDYPYSAPKVFFETRIFHPNVDEESGTICLDILKDQWSAVYSVQSVLLSIQGLLAEANPASPLNAYAAQMWERKEEYKHIVLSKYKPSN